jgi:hypothetical protein
MSDFVPRRLQVIASTRRSAKNTGVEKGTKPDKQHVDLRGY